MNDSRVIDLRVVVTAEDFSVGDEYDYLAQGTAAGAVVTFVGKVRDIVPLEAKNLVCKPPSSQSVGGRGVVDDRLCDGTCKNLDGDTISQGKKFDADAIRRTRELIGHQYLIVISIDLNAQVIAIAR